MTEAFALWRSLSLSLIAAIACVLGFAIYVALDGSAAAVAGPDLPGASITSGPASDDWNLPKHI